MGHLFPAPSGPGEASALVITLQPLPLPVRLLAVSSSVTHQLPPTVCCFLFSFLGQHPNQVFFYQQPIMERQVYKKSGPGKKCCGLLFTELPALRYSSPDWRSRWGSGLRQRKEYHKHIHGPIKMHILRKGMLKVCLKLVI